MKRIYICSPYRGDIERNTAIARKLMQMALQRGHVPIVPHLLYTQVLDEDDPWQRLVGLNAAETLIECCDEAWIFTPDDVYSDGMLQEIAFIEGWLGIKRVDISLTDNTDLAIELDEWMAQIGNRKSLEKEG